MLIYIWKTRLLCERHSLCKRERISRKKKYPRCVRRYIGEIHMKKRLLSAVLALLLALPLFALYTAPPVFADQDEPDTDTAFPESYDLRNVDGNCYVTPVRSQAPFGTCWSFATVAALESSILGAGLKGADGKPASSETLNLSEKQLAWFSAMPLRDPGNPQDGEGQFIADFMTADVLVSFMNRGGNQYFSANALGQGIGPVHESDDRYYAYRGNGNVVDYEWLNGALTRYSYSIQDDWSIPDEYRFASDYSVRAANFLPTPKSQDENGFYVYNEAGTEAIKGELMKHRAVQINFCADTSMPGQNSSAQYISENWAPYTFMPIPTNHAVTIVGWDDNYPKENFIQGTVEALLTDGTTVTIDKAPPANGAWLVKNSWGAGGQGFPDEGSGNWGIVDENGLHTGYFWLSFYDQSLEGPVSYIVEEADKSINIIDQLDYMQVAQLPSYYSEDEIKMANFFMAKKSEYIEQVACFTESENTSVTYEIYLVDEYCHAPEDGLKIAEKTVKYPYGGYHKEDISTFDILVDTSGTGKNELLIPIYEYYAITVTQKTDDGKYAVNFPSATFEDGGGVTSFKGIIHD